MIRAVVDIILLIAFIILIISSIVISIFLPHERGWRRLAKTFLGIFTLKTSRPFWLLLNVFK